MNNLTLVGRLVRDPEITKVNDDQTIVTFDIADQISSEKTQYFKVYVSTNQQKFVMDYLKKGVAVTIFGSIRENTYIDKNRITRTNYRIYANQIISTQGKKDDK